jgi:hypothetical protein
MSHDSQSHGSAGYEKKDVNVPMILWVSAATALLIVVSVLFVRDYVIMESEKATYEIRLKPDNPQLLELQAWEEAELATTRILDSTKGIYQIPIDRAIELTIEQYKSNQSTPVSDGGTRR